MNGRIKKKPTRCQNVNQVLKVSLLFGCKLLYNVLHIQGLSTRNISMRMSRSLVPVFILHYSRHPPIKITFTFSHLFTSATKSVSFSFSLSSGQGDNIGFLLVIIILSLKFMLILTYSAYYLCMFSSYR